jgi:hypothetical protein
MLKWVEEKEIFLKGVSMIGGKLRGVTMDIKKSSRWPPEEYGEAMADSGVY